MFSEGIFPIGDGLLDVDEQLLKGLLVPHDINDIYDVEQTPFARGKFAAVRRAIHKNSGVHFAAKFLKRRRRAQSSDKEIKHEIAVLMLCDGAENIVKLNAVHESRSDTALLLELATGGELQTFLDNEECLTEAQARYCMREVLKGLQFLHKRSIAHLDLKPQNILLTGENIEDGLKLCDFGISRVVAEGSNVREIVGTPDYVAPEVLQYEPLSLLTDIWSVGVLTYVLLTGFSPFGGDTKQETFLNISQCALEFPDKLFDGVSSAAIDFMRRALRIKPSDRMSAAGCLEHIWLKDECDIGRQMYNNISKVATNGDVEPSCSSNSDLDLDEDDDDVDVDGDEQQSDSQSDKMESSDVEVTQATKITRNGSFTKKTQTTTAVHTVPATRATTIPLCTHIHQKHYQQQRQQRGQQQIQQQHLPSLLTGRRHSSDANKENTFLATKKIQPITNVVNVTTTTATTNNKSTATIIIGATNTTKTNRVDVETTKNGTNISQIDHDNQIIIENNIKCNNNVNNCLFPDAPTTPKVIRKAPNSDDSSPTSVKALVKKFQLEPTAQINTTVATTTTATTTPAPPTATTAITNGTMSTVSPTTTNNKCTLILKQQKSQQAQQQPVSITKSRKSTTISPQKILVSPTTVKSILVNGNQNQRRSSDVQATNSTAKSPTTPTSPNSYKSTCVYCLTCGATSNMHSNGESSSNNTATNGCRHSAIRSTPSPTSSGSKSSLIPLYHHRHHHNHHHHQHHHHHELVVTKNGATAGAASNLSLEQGIIC